MFYSQGQFYPKTDRMPLMKGQIIVFERYAKKDVQWLRDSFLYDGVQFSFTPNQRVILELLWEKRKITRFGRLKKKGESVSRKTLEIEAPYKTEKSFRSGLSKLRRNIKECGLPISIENERPNKYILHVNYVQKAN